MTLFWETRMHKVSPNVCDTSVKFCCNNIKVPWADVKCNECGVKLKWIDVMIHQADEKVHT